MYYLYNPYSILVYILITGFIILIIKITIEFAIKHCCKLTNESNDDNYQSHEDTDNSSNLENKEINNIDETNNDDTDLPSYIEVYPNK